MTYFEAIILGLIQGITEFLPISSSGHLELVKAILGVEAKNSLIFTVIVHGATVLSTIVVFRKEIYLIFRDLMEVKWNNSAKYVVKLAISAIPIAIAGIFFEKEIENMLFGNVLLVGIMLIITGAMLSSTSLTKVHNKKVSYPGSLIIGLSQVIAIIPGISRSGATIATALLMGVKKDQATRFSFLMVLVPIIAANFKTIITNDLSVGDISITALIIGFVIAFISGLIACQLMIKIVNRGKLIYFAYYCFLIGSIAILFSLI